jgi:hypothetical protein
LLDWRSAAAQFFVSRLDIGAAEIKTSIFVCGGTCRIAFSWAFFVGLVGGIQHDFCLALFQPDPMKVVFANFGRRADDFEAKDVAIKAQGRRHIVNLK